MIILYNWSGKVKSLSHVRFFATSWTVACQAPPFMAFSRQEYWSGLPFPSPGYLPDPGIEPRSALQADALPSEAPEKHGPLKSYWIIPPALLVLQFAENRSWDFSSSLILWDNSNSTSFFIPVYMLLVLFLWRSLVNTLHRCNLFGWSCICLILTLF